MATRNPDDSSRVGRAEAAAMLGISLSHLDRLYGERATNGFPERVDGTKWLTESITSYQLPRDRARRAASAAVDRSGDPDELVNSTTVARMLGYQSADSLRGENRIWPLLLERVDDESLTATGRKRRRWKRRTVWDIADSRTGQGAPHTGRPRATPQGHPDRSGDPDELVGAPRPHASSDTTAQTPCPTTCFAKPTKTTSAPEAATAADGSARRCGRSLIKQSSAGSCPTRTRIRQHPRDSSGAAGFQARS
ncbi:hypothetical protein [Micromonospora sp. WMMD1155]|uniref:hypothetical protein n=1 Tax=Micromonospora sp. WMMD1155 TaxID=3016094 RepID=UPI00249C31F4|nr:hypothetical protein [Micromonospora sp. WMMD1155]WFE53006.1 hypothetical protein O7617_22995 [Micromonospora sp. WMMD1155]